MARVASSCRDSEAVGFDLIAKEVASDLAFAVEVERLRAKMGGAYLVTPVSRHETRTNPSDDSLV
jgi:hypothetical protein